MPETEKVVEEEPSARLRELEDLVEAHPQDASLRFDLGLFLWENGSESDAAEHFLVSAKLNPNSAPAFKYLGHYYSHCCFAHGSHGSDKEKERERALKCYQRAISLDPNDADCGEALCDILDVSGKESLELSVCEDASRKSPRSFWAFRRLGYLHLHRNKCSKAVQCLQQAIRGYPSSPDLWEALGLAYQRLGMFSAAIKSYARAIELEDTRVFGLVESGNIFLLLGSFRKGVELFQRALQISPQNISANYGLASGLLGLSKECINSGAFRWGATLLEDACKVADANTQLAGNISCVWKLHGDIQLTYAKCFPWVEDSQKTPYNMETFHASVISWKQTCHLAVTSAKRSYQRALHLAPWQASLYIDIAITSDLISSVNESYSHDIVPWQLSEKMALGGLLLEGDNYEFWVALGCLSTQGALKQHALIRGLQLDASLAAAWAYLGKLYREEGEVKLSRQAFDSARSIDPSLALPWAGMSADTEAREPSSNEAFESCLRAVQILPLAEFQIGVAKLALLSGHVASSQVFGAITQAVHRAPHHPESHNLKGLVCEARSDYQSAIASYQLARWAIYISHDNGLKSHSRDVAVNLARSLCRAGFVADAVQECESLKKEGILDAKNMQIYAFSLWQLGENDLALSVIRSLAASVSRMEQTSAAATVSFICRLLYYISGPDSAITSILKMPKELLATSKVFSLVSAIHALDKTNRLVSAISSGQYSLSSPEESIRMHYLSVLSKLIKHGSEYGLGFQNGISHLKIALHMYPNSNLLRNLLGHLLLSSEEWKDIHMACRCCIMDSSYGSNKEGLISGCEILGAGGVACYAVGNKDPKFSFPTCGYQCQTGPRAVQELQKYLRREPWNHTARYLLTLNLLQKAREERFPEQLCITLDRLILVALSNEVYSRQCMPYEYQKFQLLLCASEINLQSRNQVRCIKHAEEASSLLLPNNYLFFGHLLLCRAYAAECDYLNLREEYTKCMELKSDYHIGWICLKVMESLYDLGTGSYISELSFKECSTDLKNSWNIWVAVFNLCLGLISFRKGDLFSAEESLAQACSLASADSCVFLCHGTSCMELARQCSSTEFLSRAVRSLNKAHATSIIPLPIVSLLLAQAEGSLGSKAKWETNLRLEWYSWPPEMRPAELFFQMHLLARQQPATSSIDSSSKVEFCQSPQKWVTRAIHANPSCTRYWKVLQKLTE